jgi:hypothetical protein
VQGGDGDRAQQLELAFGVGERGERVQPDRSAWAQLDDGAAERVSEGCVFAFDVDDSGDSAEDVLAVDQRLDQAGLGRPDVSDEDHVGIGELAAIELPRVIDKGPAMQIAPHVHATGAQAALGHERVGGLQVRARHPVTRALGWDHARAHARNHLGLHHPPWRHGHCASTRHDSPRHRGRPKVKA